jgi:hypothetical protein
VQGEGGGEVGEGGEGPALLALRQMAPLPVGQLEAASAPELPALRRPSLLVPQPQEHQLRYLRRAN